MAENSSPKWHARIGRVLLAAMVLNLTILPTGFAPSVRAQDVTVELDEVTAAIKGQDVTIYARTTGEADEAKLFIRNLLDLGDFNDLAMEKTGATSFRYVLPLSQQQGELQRLEYYVEVYRAGQPVAKTESYVISFIDPPFVGEVTAFPTEGLEKEDWKLFIKGRISRPFYKKWWLWALLGAAGVGATALLVQGDETIAGPPTVALVEDRARSEHDDSPTNPSATFLLCEGRVPMTLTINLGEAPYEAIFTATATSGEGAVRVSIEGAAGNIPFGQEIVVGGTTLVPADLTMPGTFAVTFGNIDLQAVAPRQVAAAGITLSAVVRDNRSTTSFAGATPGGALPSAIRQALDSGSDERLLQEVSFQTMFSNCQQTE